MDGGSRPEHSLTDGSGAAVGPSALGSAAPPLYIFDECVTHAVTPLPGHPGSYEAALRSDWSNEGGSAFGGFMMALSNRAAQLYLRDTGNGDRFPDPISIQAQFLGPTKGARTVRFDVETVRQGKSIAYLQLRAGDKETGTVYFAASFAYGSLRRDRADLDFEEMAMPRLPPLEDCEEYGSPFRSKYFDYKVSWIPKGTDPLNGKQKTAAYVGWRDGRPLDLASACLLGDIWTDFRIFHHIRRRPARQLRMSGSIAMTLHFFHVPSPGCKLFVSDMDTAITQGVGDYALHMWDSNTGKLVAVARQVQQMWAVRNGKEKGGPKL
ncbi:thioesterase-like superfamily-domain-containing protein [Hyaloraphidium curvatum]|nr:thioesterase-like superfamily-domain-containing protein [Hyaloraphidium curvatum]